MSNERSDGWIEWRGGECPVDKTVKVDVRFQDGEVFERSQAQTWTDEFSPEDYWKHQCASPSERIVAYRVCENQR